MAGLRQSFGRFGVGIAFASLATIPISGQAITEFSAGTIAAGPRGIATGPDGNIWFTLSFFNNAIGRITRSGDVTLFPIPTPFSAPAGITAGPDGALWFTESSGNRIGRISTAGLFTEFPLSQPDSRPGGITLGPDGAMWFTENGRIGRITVTGIISESAVPPSNAGGITAGSDGALWFAGNGVIGRVTNDGVVTTFPANPSGPITAGPDGSLWYTEWDDLRCCGRIARITPSGMIREFALPTTGLLPITVNVLSGVTTGPDGNVWFTEGGQFAPGRFTEWSKIGRITTDGVLTEFPTPTYGGLGGITTGPDGNLWFTEFYLARIGRISTGTPIPRSPLGRSPKVREVQPRQSS